MDTTVGLNVWITMAVVIALALYRRSQHRKNDAHFAGGRQALPRQQSSHRDWPSVVRQASEDVRQLQKPSVALELTDEPVRGCAHSSIGGRPSLDPTTPWPLDSGGRPMIFLAQINYADMPSLEDFPNSGLLSVFVEDNDLNGCEFPSRNRGFIVMYHEETANLLRHALPDSAWDYTPFSAELCQNGRTLKGHRSICHVSPNSAEVMRITADWYPDCPTDLWDKFSDALTEGKPSPLYYGGHPDFTQEDFRQIDDNPAHSEVLLQLGWLTNRKDGVEICWGDAGEACFLVSPKDLTSRKFGNAVYNWDCC